DEAWPLLSAKDRAYHSVDAMRRDAKLLDDPNTKAVLEHTRFEMGRVTINGEGATVVQRVTSPDMSAIVARAQSDPANDAKLKTLSPDDAQRFGHRLLEAALARPDCPMSTHEETVPLVREGGEWKVVADFEGHDRQERERALHADPVLRDLQGQPPERRNASRTLR